MANLRFVQIKGPFAANEDVVNRIKINTPQFGYIRKLGIQTKATSRCIILERGKPETEAVTFEIGKTGMLEFNNVEIVSIKFLQNEPATTLVDCTII